MKAGIGTHIDAPNHCIPGGASISEIPLSQLIAPCVVLNVVDRVKGEDYLLSTKEITDFEERHGLITAGNIVLIQTGWERFWNDPNKYRNNLRFPSISEESARLFVERKVAAVGIDTLGVDLPTSGYPAHRILLGAGTILIENVATLSQMPTQGGYVFCLPIKGQNLTEAPCRMIGLRPRL